MIPFFVLLLGPMLIQHTAFGTKYNIEKKKNNAMLFFFSVLTVLVMFRHKTVGTDTENYIYFFNDYALKDWISVGKKSIEFGFSYLNKVISLFSEQPQFFLAVTAVLTSAMIYPTYKRLCTDPSLSIALFCILSTFLMYFSGIRQMLAIGIGFIAYECTRNKKLIPFILIVVFAMTFHTSAFMLAFMYPLYHAKITKKWLFAVVPGLLIVFIFNKPIFSFLSAIIERYTVYEGGISSTGAYTMLILFAAFTVFSFLIPDEKSLDSETIGLRNFLLLSLSVQLFAPLHVLAMRMNYYYIMFIPLLLPKIIANRSKAWDQVAIIARYVMVAFFVVYFFFSAYTSDVNLNVFPYHFFWEDV